MRKYPNLMGVIEESKGPNYDSASMEREHASQLSLLTDLKVAVRGGAPDSLVYALLNELVEHTNLHFLSEQLAMKLHAYEASESHLVEHERLLLEVQNLSSSLTTATAADKAEFDRGAAGLADRPHSNRGQSAGRIPEHAGGAASI